MIRCCFVLLFVSCFVTSYSQIYGSWQGQMKSRAGIYTFNLDIRPNSETGYIKGVAVHNRNGEKMVIELSGKLYGDQSVYFSDTGDRYRRSELGQAFSKLQFMLKYQDGELVLDGHWQEYKDLRHYRKGRLVLYKRKQKA